MIERNPVARQQFKGFGWKENTRKIKKKRKKFKIYIFDWNEEGGREGNERKIGIKKNINAQIFPSFFFYFLSFIFIKILPTKQPMLTILSLGFC